MTVSDGASGASGRVVELAPAKVNLCLHVTGRRPDGYHELDTLVAFADLGDTVTVDRIDGELSLHVSSGLMPADLGNTDPVVPAAVDNLAWRALALWGRETGALDGLTLGVDKRLPAGAGLGGGSSDAAATLRALSRLTGTPPGDRLRQRSVALGADVPMCLEPRPWRARGIGERLEPVALGRDLPVVLVWPGRAVATPAVFRARAGLAAAGGFGPAVPDAALGRLAADPITALAELRNDLTDAACAVEPAVAEALAAVGQLPGCRLARMSGSGSAVFGLFEADSAAAGAAVTLQERRPDWWVRATVLRATGVETRLDRPPA